MTDITPDRRCFVDTNIWLYAFIRAEDEKKNRTAQSVITGNEIIISTQIINEISVNLLKKAGFTEPRIYSLITSLYKRYSVLEFSREILLQASKIRSRFNFSFWDSLVAAAALECEAEFLVSEDMQHGLQLSTKLPIINPFQ